MKKQLSITGTSKRATLLISLGIMIMLIGMGLVSAQSTYKQGDTIQLTAICDNCTNVNLTQVTYPNGTFALLGDYNMTDNGTTFFYSFSDTSTIGTYRYVTCGDLNGDITCQDTTDRSFEINPVGGVENNLTIFLILLIISVSVFLLSLLLRNYIFAIIGGFGLMAAGMYGIIYGFGDITSLYTRIISYIIIGVGAIITITSALELMQEMYGGSSNEEDDE